MKKIGIKLSAAVIAISLLSVSMVQPVAKASEIVNTDAVYYAYYQGQRIDDYTLQKVYPLDTLNNREIFGVDSRYPDNTKIGVCKIITVGGGMGTGFVLDDHTIITAAHCVANASSDYTMTSGVVIEEILFFDSNGNVSLTLDEDDIYAAHVPYNYFHYNANGYFAEYDYAAITTFDDVLSDYAMFNLSYATEYLKTANPTLYCSGFPGFVTGQQDEVNNQTTHQCYTGTGTVRTVEKTVITHYVDISGGDSGGPVYTITNYDGKTYYNAVGILVADAEGSHNTATRFTTDVLHFYKNNPYF